MIDFSLCLWYTGVVIKEATKGTKQWQRNNIQ